MSTLNPWLQYENKTEDFIFFIVGCLRSHSPMFLAKDSHPALPLQVKLEHELNLRYTGETVCGWHRFNCWGSERHCSADGQALLMPYTRQQTDEREGWQRGVSQTVLFFLYNKAHLSYSMALAVLELEAFYLCSNRRLQFHSHNGYHLLSSHCKPDSGLSLKISTVVTNI